MTAKNPHYERGMLLIQQRRFDRAIEEFRQAILQQPDNARSHAWLAYSLSESTQHQEANTESQLAIGMAPEDSVCHYVRSSVLSEANCYPEAEAAIRQAIDLHSGEAEYYGQLAVIQIRQQKWTEGLEFAELGLQLDPENHTCMNMRSIALVKLGRSGEAAGALESALEREPEDEWVHANLGWALVEQGRYDQALNHFQEALRVNHELEHARLGVITCLKAKSVIYRPVLNYFLWVQKLKTKYAWMFIIGLLVGVRMLNGWRRTNPEMAPFLTVVLYAYFAFVLSQWLSDPLGDLALLTSRFGRLALSDEQKKTARLVGTCLLAAVLTFALFWTNDAGFFGGLCFLFACLPLALVYHAEQGWPRWAIAGMGGLLVMMGICPLAVAAFEPVLPKVVLALLLLVTFGTVQSLTLVAIVTQIGSQLIVQRRPRRIAL